MKWVDGGQSSPGEAGTGGVCVLYNLGDSLRAVRGGGGGGGVRARVRLTPDMLIHAESPQVR